MPRHPALFANTPAALASAAPALGADTDEVLTDHGLGDRIDDLRVRGVIA